MSETHKDQNSRCDYRRTEEMKAPDVLSGAIIEWLACGVRVDTVLDRIERAIEQMEKRCTCR